MGRLCGFRFRCQHTTKCCNGENQCIVIKVMFHTSKILSVSASRHTTSSAYHICKILSSKNMLFFAAFCRKTDGHEYQRDYRNFMLAKIRSIRTSGKCTSKNSCKPLVAAMPSIRCDQRNTAPTVITASNKIKANSSHVRIFPIRFGICKIPFAIQG